MHLSRLDRRNMLLLMEQLIRISVCDPTILLAQVSAIMHSYGVCLTK